MQIRIVQMLTYSTLPEMCNLLDHPERWAQSEFAAAAMGDTRRTRRLVQVAEALAQCPSGTLPQAFPDWAELKAAYRLFSNSAVTYAAILAPHWARTRQSCSEPGEYLWIEDTTLLDYSAHKAVRGLGRIGNDGGVGLLLHTTLALRVEAWQLDQTPDVSVVGLLDQQCWTRQGRPRKGRETRRQLLSRKRESQRWAEVVSELPPRPREATWIFLADREADIYETFDKCQAKGVDFVIRATCPRALAEGDQNIFQAVSSAPVQGTYELELRARPETPARRVTLAIRTQRVSLRGPWRPGGKLPPLELNVVEAREIDPPAGAEPICWVLLTSLSCDRFVQAQRIIARYARRWLIEEYHKALKTGARVESSQLEERGRIEALLGVLAIVAVRLLGTKLLARARPDERVDVTHFGVEAVEILSQRFGRPSGGWTHATLLIAVARLGGFLARRGDGMPGWITIWRGWQRLMTMTDGVKTLSRSAKGIEAKRCG